MGNFWLGAKISLAKYPHFAEFTRRKAARQERHLQTEPEPKAHNHMENGSTCLVRTGRGLDNLKLTSIADLLPGAVYDLQDVSAGEIKPHVPNVPTTGYHVRVELENGTDRHLSFDAEFIRETDERSGSAVEYYDLYRLHLDGKPCTEADVDRLFDGGIERLEQWLFAQTEACTE